MGTSSNQGSPNTPSWRAAKLAYGGEGIGLERAMQEVWRAATSQGGGGIAEKLGDPLVGELLAIAVAAPSRQEATSRVARRVAESGESSFAAVLAQRVAGASVPFAADPVSTFASRLFEEANSYLVSRDLPGYVGAGRARSVTEAIALKRQLRDRVVQAVAEVQRPASVEALVAGWPEYVQNVVERLRGTPGAAR